MAGCIQTYYHYTTLEAARAIVLSGYIEQSIDLTTDARYGVGVYVTDMGLDHTRRTVANAIFGNAAHYMLDKGKLDAVIELYLPSNIVIRPDLMLNIYKVQERVSLNATNHRVYVRDTDGKFIEYKFQ
ncbi:uncharacterized protein LOC117326034 [Pecten maximus]|uniref:uncharacterized protein LOC117326034 n=1 Tax=Pecten maximus TaxID=6579 RepID=UPI001457FEAF|nr:uncharacterized protein LOC117326034 [Pecten maximus]